MNGKGNQPGDFWKSLTKLDWAAVFLCAGGIWATWSPNQPANATAIGVLKALGILASSYLIYRLWTKWRAQLLWSLRNRLVVAYLFIGGLPVFLLLILALIAGQILYSQFAAYLLNHEIQDRVDALGDSCASIAAAEATLPASFNKKFVDQALSRQVETAQGKRLPNLKLDFEVDPKYFRLVAGEKAHSYSGLVQSAGQLRLVSMQEVE